MFTQYPKLLELAAHYGGKLSAQEILCFKPCNKNYVERTRAFGAQRSVSCSYDAPAAVALDGAAYLLARSYSNTANTCAVFYHIGDQRRIGFDFAPGISTVKILILF